MWPSRSAAARRRGSIPTIVGNLQHDLLAIPLTPTDTKLAFACFAAFTSSSRAIAKTSSS